MFQLLLGIGTLNVNWIIEDLFGMLRVYFFPALIPLALFNIYKINLTKSFLAYVISFFIIGLNAIFRADNLIFFFI